jgi:hypothetical protein
MFTFRNMTALGLFFFGTTFLWLTPAFLGGKRELTGIAWSVLQGLVLLTILGFALAAWGIFKDSSWWQLAAVISGAFGIAAVIPYWIATRGMTGIENVGSNLAIHGLGSLLVVTALVVPLCRDWLVARL